MNPAIGREPIVIVGGGIGGLSAAITLARNGYEVKLIERASQFTEIGAGIQVGPNGYKMLERLGLSEEAARVAVFPQELTMMDSVSGDVVTTVPTGDDFVKRFHYPYTLIHRADLHAVLLKACRTEARITLLNGCKAKRFSHRDDGGIVLHTQSGEDILGSGLVGADGMWSVIRQQIVGDGAPRVSGHIAYRAVLPIENVPEQCRKLAMILWAGPKNHLVQYPLRGGQFFNLVAVFHSDQYLEGWNIEGDPEELKRRFRGTCITVQALLSKIDDWRMWVLCDREPVKNWSEGAATLVGDAAHPMLQYLAQGACMALEDAVVLAESVKEAAGDLTTAFQHYQQARYLRTGKCQLLARVYGEFYHASSVARELRNAMLSNRTQEASYEGLAWLYDFG